jgi:hypothetical protein
MVEMDATISKLEYTLKDADISASPYLVQHITETIRLLRGVMEYKRKQWTKQEEEMGGCPCGGCPVMADSKSPHSSD